MPHRRRWLFKEQTLVRRCEVHATAARLTRQYKMIGRRIVTSQRQLQSTLARQRTVTSARVAPELRHNWNDVIAKTPREWLVEFAHDNFGGCVLRAKLRSYRRLPITCGT